MDMSGEYKFSASPDVIIKSLKDPSFLKSSLPNCVALNEVKPGLYHAILERLTGLSGQIAYLLFITEEEGNILRMAWQSEDAHALMPSGEIVMTLEMDDFSAFTRVRHETRIVLNEAYAQASQPPGEALNVVTRIFEALSDRLETKKGASAMSDHNLQDQLNEAGNPAIELEQEAEEAAAKGKWGGPQMWGWIALAAMVAFLVFLAA